MSLSRYVLAALGLLALSFAVFRVIVLHTYLRRGRLGLWPGLLNALAWLPFFVFPYLYNPPDWAWFWLHPHPLGTGWLLGALCLVVFGLAFLVVAMAQLGLPHATGGRAAVLFEKRLYRLSRNPQILGGVPLIVGLALLWPSWCALGWVALYLAMAHMMVLTEEDHLRHRHGQAYVEYCARVPRYLRVSRASASKDMGARP